MFRYFSKKYGYKIYNLDKKARIINDLYREDAISLFKPKLSANYSSTAGFNGGFYANFIKKEFPTLQSFSDFVSQQNNKERLLELTKLMREVFEESETLEEFNKAAALRKIPTSSITVEPRIFNGIRSVNKLQLNQPFMQRRLIDVVNQHWESLHENKQFNESGICKELVIAWYFFSIHQKDLLGECNLIIDKLISKKELSLFQNELLALVLGLQQGGRVWLSYEKNQLSPACLMEEYLSNRLRYRLNTYLNCTENFPKYCRDFSERLIDSLKDNPNQLKLIYIGWQEKDLNLSERSHVLGLFQDEEKHHFFDPNSGVQVIPNSEKPEILLTNSLSASLEKFKKVFPHSNFYLRSSVPLEVKELSLERNSSLESKAIFRI